jgi:hypothetical protein
MTDLEPGQEFFFCFTTVFVVKQKLDLAVLRREKRITTWLGRNLHEVGAKGGTPSPGAGFFNGGPGLSPHLWDHPL